MWTPQNLIRRAVRPREMAVPDADEAVLARGPVEEERDVRQRPRAAAMVHREGLEQAVVPLGEGARRGEQEEGDWFGSHGRIDRLYQFAGALSPNQSSASIVWVWPNRRPLFE